MFEFLGVQGILMVISLMTIPLVISFLVIYVLGALRRDKAENPDRFLGARVFLLLLMSMAFQIVLLGLVHTMNAAMADNNQPGGLGQPNDDRAMNQAMGTLLGGLIAAIYPTLLYIMVRVRERRTDYVLRAALGVNAIITGLSFTLNVTLLMTAMMLDADDLNELICLTVVYLGGSLLCGIPVALAVSMSPRSTMPPPPRY